MERETLPTIIDEDNKVLSSTDVSRPEEGFEYLRELSPTARLREFKRLARAEAITAARELLGEVNIGARRYRSDQVVADSLTSLTIRVPRSLLTRLRTLDGALTHSIEKAIKLYLLLMEEPTGETPAGRPDGWTADGWMDGRGTGR